MKNRSLFSLIILLVILSVVCVVITVSMAFLAGSTDTTIFDFRNMNFANMIPIFIIGGFISCVIIGITVLFIARAVFTKFKDYFNESNKNNGGNQK